MTNIRNIKIIINYTDPLSFTARAFSNFNYFNRWACWSLDDAKCGSKIQCQHSHKDISVKEINVLAIRKINTEKLSKRKHE